MKKLGLIVFVSALLVGLLSALNCSVGNFGGVKGSGNAKTEKRNVSGFDEIEASGAVSLEIVAQKDFSVEVEADDNLLSFIETEVSGDTLKIYSEDRISPKTKINIKVSMPKIEDLEVSGASSANVANVNADSLELKASGASKIKIDGTAKELNADASGASTIDAENLKTEDAEIEASGASKAIVSATNDLEVDASGASKITYIGEPKNIKQDSSGASSVTKK